MDGGVWLSTVPRVTESDMTDVTEHTHTTEQRTIQEMSLSRYTPPLTNWDSTFFETSFLPKITLVFTKYNQVKTSLLAKCLVSINST